jgi:hypothetical protein
MLGRALVRPLEDDWREAIDLVARRRGWPTSRDVAKLAANVARLSEAYNDRAVARAPIRDAGPARLGFAFARDVPKGAAAVRELVAVGAVISGDAPLRVLDVGAGLGAATWGLVRALEAASAPRRVEATWWDSDARALELGTEIWRERGEPFALERRVIPLTAAVGSGGEEARFDVILASQVLSELDVGEAPDIRLARHAELLARLLERHTETGGCLVVVEPALRDRTRHLHRVRDALVSLHARPCPALADESDWCHEDLSIDLPRWLVPVARAAGLRHEGLSFSYLVLRRDGARLADSVPARSGAARLRVVSEPMRTKGKRDAFLCGELADPSAAGARVAARLRTTRLDRDASAENASWEELRRGDVLVVDPAPDPRRPRVDRATKVSRLGDAESR